MERWQGRALERREGCVCLLTLCCTVNDYEQTDHQLPYDLHLRTFRTLCKRGNDCPERKKETLWNTQLRPRVWAVCVPVAGAVQRWIAIKHIDVMLEREKVGACPALSRSPCKPYHKTAASKPAWPFWILHCKWGPRNTSHWFMLPLLPLAPGASNSYLLEKKGKSQQRNISEATGNNVSSSVPHIQQWCIPGSMRHANYLLHAQSMKFVCAIAKKSVQAWANSSGMRSCWD